MVTIDISGKNRELFDGKVGHSSGAFHINLQGQEGYDIVYRNALKIVTSISEDERDEVLISGIAPRWVALAVAAAVGPYFKVIKHFDGKDLIVLRNQNQPPLDLPPRDEDEG